MNLRLLEFQELSILIERMGGGPSTWKPGSQRLDPLEELRRELEVGKEIPLADVTVSFGSLLTYKGEQVVLYIKDTRLEKDTLLYDIEHSRRFHIADCETLQRMREEGRYERYVVTTRKDGKFSVEATDHLTGYVEELEAPLGVCRNCLKGLNWMNFENSGFNEKKRLWKEFVLEDFFREFSTFFAHKPTHTDQTAPRGGYAREWSMLSTKIRRDRNWTCEDCGVNLSEHHRLLHCHHKNGVVSDNSPRNIAALCVLCHAKQPAHNYIKPKPADRLLIEQLRSLKGLRKGK